MKHSNRKPFGRVLTSLLLSGLLLSGGMLPAKAEQPRYPQAPVASKSSSEDTLLAGLGALAALGVACALLGCFDGGEEESRSGGSRYRPHDGEADASADDNEDTSIGCYWGDRAYGTCR